MRKDRESIRITLLELYSLSFSDTKAMKAIQNRLDILLKDKISQNLVDLLYPAVTANLIYAFGLCETEKTDISIHKILIDMLMKYFDSAFNRNEIIAMDMLPNDTSYDQKSGRLVRIVKFARGRDRTEKLFINKNSS